MLCGEWAVWSYCCEWKGSCRAELNACWTFYTFTESSAILSPGEFAYLLSSYIRSGLYRAYQGLFPFLRYEYIFLENRGRFRGYWNLQFCSVLISPVGFQRAELRIAAAAASRSPESRRTPSITRISRPDEGQAEKKGIKWFRV